MEEFDVKHPLLNDVVLETLIPLIHPGDLPSFRSTCSKWLNFSCSRFKREFTVDLTPPENTKGNATVVTRKIARFIYAMPPPALKSLPFDRFKLSETKLGVASLHRSFTGFLPYVRKLTLITNNPSIHDFCKLLWNLDTCEELRLAIPAHISSSVDNLDNLQKSEGRRPLLPKLRVVQWLKNPRENEDEGELFAMEFLTNFYGNLKRLESLEFSLGVKEVWKHLVALKSFNRVLPVKKLLFRGTLGRLEMDALVELAERGMLLNLDELEMRSFGGTVRSEELNRLLEIQGPCLKCLGVGWTSRDRVDPLFIRIPQGNPNLRKLWLGLSAKIRYERVNPGNFRNLRELSISVKDEKSPFFPGERIHFLEDVLHLKKECFSVDSLVKLELTGVPLRFGGDSLCTLNSLFPSIRSLTLDRMSKQAMKELWLLWPNLVELKILSAPLEIDEVLTGIPMEQCRKILIGRLKGEEYSKRIGGNDGNSIRNLKYLQRLEINSGLNKRGLTSLSCLPSDISIQFALLKMPELRNILIHRSLISREAMVELEAQKSVLHGHVQIQQIQFEFDESVDAFQFHRRNHHFMKLLCGYPHQDLRALPSFLNSLWMNGQLDL